MDEIKMINGDCLVEMKKLSAGSVDLLFADLPYMGVDNKTSEVYCDWNKPIDLVEIWKEINRITKPTTPCFFTCSTKFGVALINSNPKNFRYDLVWVKSRVCGFLNAKKMPMKKHEMVYVFYRKLPMYNLSSHTHKFLNDGDIEIFAPPTENGCYRTVKRNIIPSAKGSHRYEPPLPTSILEIKCDRGHHQTQKPVELIEWILKYYSNEGDTVLDPTAGSFSTAIACADMNRKFIGFEINTDIYNKGVARVAKRLNKNDLNENS
jgi:site-specific DNA-methyltransferase (adenine-specific)